MTCRTCQYTFFPVPITHYQPDNPKRNTLMTHPNNVTCSNTNNVLFPTNSTNYFTFYFTLTYDKRVYSHTTHREFTMGRKAPQPP